MTATPEFSNQCESEPVASAFRRIVTRPWSVFIIHWNWKAALLSGGIRGAMFCFVMLYRGASATEGALIEILFRVVTGGCWGSLLQALRKARPAWLAGLLATVLVPGAAHLMEFGVLKAGGTTHIRSVMVVSIVFSAGSLLVNFALMRRGLMITGDGAASLGSDFRHLPGALKQCAVAWGKGFLGVIRRLK